MKVENYITNKHVVTIQEDEMEQFVIDAAKKKLGKDVDDYDVSVHFSLGQDYLKEIEVTFENTAEVK